MNTRKTPYLCIKTVYKDDPDRDEYQLWLVVDATHERHLDSSFYKTEMWDLAMQIKTAGIELE